MLVLGHREHEGAHINVNGNSLDVIVRAINPGKQVFFEIMQGSKKNYLLIEQGKERKIAPDITICVPPNQTRIYKSPSLVKVGYGAPREYSISRRKYR